MPDDCAAVRKRWANLGARRSAGGVGSGSARLSHTVELAEGPSSSGFGAGWIFGSSTKGVAAAACFAAGAEWCGVPGALAAGVPSAEPPPDVLAAGAELGRVR